MVVVTVSSWKNGVDSVQIRIQALLRNLFGSVFCVVNISVILTVHWSFNVIEHKNPCNVNDLSLFQIQCT